MNKKYNKKSKSHKIVTKEEILSYLRLYKPYLATKGVIKIGLFGSYAKGIEKPESDIDVFIECEKGVLKHFKDGMEALVFFEDFREGIERYFKKSVDLVDFTFIKKCEKVVFLKGAIVV